MAKRAIVVAAHIQIISLNALLKSHCSVTYRTAGLGGGVVHALMPVSHMLDECSTFPCAPASGVEFSEDSSGEMQSTDSESWDTSKEPRHRRRRRKR